jgi:hypothetical protein
MTMTQEKINENFKCILNFLDSPIYRFYTVCQLTEIFNRKKDVLVRPEIWDDPFENFLFRQEAISHDGKDIISFNSIRKKLYAQCWTLNTNMEETDIFWRVYSPNKDRIRVQTTLKKLFDNFYNPTKEFAQLSYFIGKVNYKTEEQIQTFFENPGNLNDIFYGRESGSGRSAVQTLLIKRSEFKYENEVRLIYYANNEQDDTTKDTYEYDLDPNEIFDELIFDPRFNEECFKAKMEEFKKQNFEKHIDISKSYSAPKLNLRM